MAKTISLFSLVLLICGPIDSVRNFPASGLFGSSLVFFFMFSAVVFLIPIALVAAELSANCPQGGGVYQWVKLAFGKKWAFLTIWLQWINTMVWFPSILSFIAGTLSYLIDPTLAQNKIYLISVISGTFWLLTLLNLKGIDVSVKFINYCSVVGILLPVSMMIILTIIWIVSGKPLQISFSSTDWFPSFEHVEHWISLTAIMTSFLGIELACVHVREVKNPQKAFPRALMISVGIILFTMIMGSLAIAVVIPKEKINLVSGVVEAFTQFFSAYHLEWLLSPMIILMLLGSLGGMTSWMISPAKGLMEAAECGYLPTFFSHKNAKGIASHLLIVQAVLVTLVCLVFLLFSSVNGSYWFLTALSTQLYMVMYVILLMAAIKLKYGLLKNPVVMIIPGGKLGIWLVGLIGVIGCGITLIVGFIPPAGIYTDSLLQYELAFVVGMVALIAPALFLVHINKDLSLPCPECP